MNKEKLIPLVTIVFVAIFLIGNFGIFNFPSQASAENEADTQFSLLALLNRQTKQIGNNINDIERHLNLPVSDLNAPDTSFKYAPDKVPIIAFSAINSHLTVNPWLFAKCGDKICDTIQTNQIVDSMYTTTLWRGIKTVIGSDGLPLVGYLLHNSVYIKHCDTVTCTSDIKYQPLSIYKIRDFDLEINSNGLPAIAFSTNAALYFLACDTISCKTPTANAAIQIDSDAIGPLTMEIGVDGKPIIFYSGNNDELNVIHCGNLHCTNGNTKSKPLASTGFLLNHQYPLQSAVQKKGFINPPYITFIRSHPIAELLYVARCTTTDCSTVKFHGVKLFPKNHLGARFHSPAVDHEGNVGIAFYAPTPGGADVNFFKCLDQDCVTFGEITIDSVTDSLGEPTYGQLFFGEDNTPVIVYAKKIFTGDSLGSLHLVRCENSNCNIGEPSEAKISYTKLRSSPEKLGDYLSISEIER